jgi:hypothetical protein
MKKWLTILGVCLAMGFSVSKCTINNSTAAEAWGGNATHIGDGGTLL